MRMACILCGSTDDVGGVKSLRTFFGTRSSEPTPDDGGSKASPWGTFILTKLFKFSKDECQGMLEGFGGEGDQCGWLKTCGSCVRFVEQFRKRHEQLLEIQREVDSMRNVAVGKLLGLRVGDGNGPGMEVEDSLKSLQDQIRGYFRGVSIRPCLMSSTGAQPNHIEDEANADGSRGEAELDLIPNSNIVPAPEGRESSSHEIEVSAGADAEPGTSSEANRSPQEIQSGKKTDKKAVGSMVAMDYAGTTRNPVRSSLTKHKQHSCGFCPKSFPRSALIVHLRTHTGERPFVCEICQKGFASRSNKNAHMTTHNQRSIPLACIFCDKRFARESHLRDHTYVHTQEKPNFCKECGKEFSTSSNAVDHYRRVHTRERRYRCEICDKGFSSSGELLSHLRMHTYERPYKCKECGRAFKDKGSLKYHATTKKHDLN